MLILERNVDDVAASICPLAPELESRNKNRKTIGK